MDAGLVEAIESTGLGDKWRRQGREEGLKEGVKELKLRIARNALQMGLSVQDTARLTGLTENEIEALVN